MASEKKKSTGFPSRTFILCSSLKESFELSWRSTVIKLIKRFQPTFSAEVDKSMEGN